MNAAQESESAQKSTDSPPPPPPNGDDKTPCKPREYNPMASLLERHETAINRIKRKK